VTTVNRRDFLSGLVGLGATASMGGWLSLPSERNPLLDRISRWNDAAQGWLFSPHKLAPTYPVNAITRAFPYNGFYPEAYAPSIDPVRWRLNITGQVRRPRSLSLPELQSWPMDEQITRLICIEGWSAIGQWGGIPLATLLRSIGADPKARFIRVDCADGYFTTIDRDSAMHPQTLLALTFLGRPLSPAYGAPLRLRIPVKLGFKNAKYIHTLTVTDKGGEGYWEDQGYNWFSGL